MTKLGINTDFAGEFEKIEDIRRCLGQIANAGFSHMHWCFEWDGDYLYAASEMQQIREWMEEHGCNDAHMLSGEGSIDWPALMKRLRGSAYEAPWVLEVNKPADEDAESFLRRAHQAGEWMAGL